MLRKTIILFFALFACANAYNNSLPVFTPQEIKAHLEQIKQNAGGELRKDVHPAYLIANVYASDNVWEVVETAIDEVFKDKALNTAWKIINEGYGFGGFSTTMANDLERRAVLDTIMEELKKRSRNGVVDTSKLPINPSKNPWVEAHRAEISKILDNQTLVVINPVALASQNQEQPIAAAAG